MATAVLDLDLHCFLENHSSDNFCLPGYTKAMILIRWRSNPIGNVYVSFENGNLPVQDCYNSMMEAVKDRYWKYLLNDYIGWDERDQLPVVTLKATVAICTRDRTEDLKRCLDVLVQLPDDGQEVLVVDNCPSSDSTSRLVQVYPQVRYVCEMKAGLNNARNRALMEAKHDVVAFIDDDAVPDPNWLRALLINFRSQKVMCVTGLTMPLELETPAQEAFEKYGGFAKGFERKLHTKYTGNPIATGDVGAGANMALRKCVIETIGFFDESLDTGTPTKSGGDHEMFGRILVAGYHIIYDPRALNWHRHRKTWADLRKTVYGYGVGVYALLTKHLVTDFDLSVFKIAFQWFWRVQSRNLFKALLHRPNHQPLDLILAELSGCLKGPFAYFKARKKANEINKVSKKNEAELKYYHTNS